jgi:predicted O-methyltransferase YrrM
MTNISTLYEQLEIPENDRITSIRKQQAEWTYSFLKDKEIAQTIETGFAYGCSTAYIMSATNAPHIAIDPYQDYYKNLGLKNIEKLGLSSRFRFEKDLSLKVLPKLLAEGIKCDFAFIDGGHRFDDIFIDFCHIDFILKDQGWVMFDDRWMRSTQHVASFIITNREDYELVPTPMQNIFLFQKVGIDTRDWHHFNNFCLP